RGCKTIHEGNKKIFSFYLGVSGKTESAKSFQATKPDNNPGAGNWCRDISYKYLIFYKGYSIGSGHHRIQCRKSQFDPSGCADCTKGFHCSYHYRERPYCN